MTRASAGTPAARRPTVTVIRRLLLWIIAIGLIGTEVELVLIKHTEGAWEIAPLALIAVTVIPFAWTIVRPGRPSLRTFQATMLMFVAIGGLGVLLHYRANIDWEHESNPSLSGWELYLKALKGATPMLAPGAMVQLGLVGLVFAFRHPGFGGSVDEPQPSGEER